MDMGTQASCPLGSVLPALQGPPGGRDRYLFWLGACQAQGMRGGRELAGSTLRAQSLLQPGSRRSPPAPIPTLPPKSGQVALVIHGGICVPQVQALPPLPPPRGQQQTVRQVLAYQQRQELDRALSRQGQEPRAHRRVPHPSATPQTAPAG